MLAEGCACPMETDTGVRGGDVVLLGEVLNALFPEIYRTKGLGILRFQAVEQTVQAGTDFIVKLRRWLGRGLQLACPCFKSFVLRDPSAVAVDHRIPEHAVEPCCDRFARREVALMLKGTEIGSLQDVFGECGVRDPSLHEGKELLAL